MRRLLWFALCLLPVSAAPRIVYSKSFPGSVPAYVQIVLDRDGKAVYKEAPDDEQPLKFEMKKEETEAIFALAEKLEFFKRELESGLKVANMGMKTLRWEDGANASEAKFNFSQDADARTLVDWFEKMTETEQHLMALERAVRFDKLGTNKVLLKLQAAMERERLTALAQFIPMLERIVKNSSFLNLDRERAANLLEWIRDGKPKYAQ